MYSYFHFSKGERKGIILISLLLIAIQIIRYALPETASIPLEERIQIDSLFVEVRERREVIKENRREQMEIDFAQFGAFDPNTLTEEDWTKLGLSQKQAASVKSYQNRFGTFKSKRAFKKLYVISDEFYQGIETYLLLPDTLTFTNKLDSLPSRKQSPRLNYPKLEININEADTLELVQLFGIGAVLSRRIVNYRKALGGFHSIEQIKEVYGLSEETYENIKEQIYLESLPLKRININQASKEELKQHPYIRWRLANAIVNYRKQHGEYQNLIDLKELELINDSIFQRISIYLQR